MSGTSLDAIDVAVVEISGAGRSLRHRLLSFHSRPFDSALRARLLDACEGRLSLRETFELDADLGEAYADVIEQAALEAPRRLDAIGLHGQTVYHAPGRRPNGVTVQLGSGAIVAERLGVPVVDDFRSNDVAAGGQGAPLVPYCDLVLLHAAERDRVALNIGGIANITWLPREATPATLIAFDTGPGNMLIDAAARRFFDRDYDPDGELAGAGRSDERWLEELLGHPYFEALPPKSTGRELFGEEVGRRWAEEGRLRGLSEHDVLATLTRLTARSIARGIGQVHVGRGPVHEVVVGGGGTRNRTMMAMLRDELPDSRVVPADELGIRADAKEAICFAILANEALCGVPANVPSVTGASRPVICGAIRLP